MVRSSAASPSSRARRFFLFRGRKPSKVNRPVGRPDTDNATVSAQGPGREITSTPAAAHRATSSSPGSETAGVPASVTRAQLSPASIRRRMAGPAASQLWRW